MTNGIYRQGDVLLVPIHAIPDGLKQDGGDVVLALGEEHGHKHMFKEGTGVCGFYKEGDDNMIAGGTALIGAATRINYVLVTGSGATLEHLGKDGERADHNPIPVEPGAYEVRRQREYVAEGIERAVVD